MLWISPAAALVRELKMEPMPEEVDVGVDGVVVVAVDEVLRRL